MQNQVLGHCRLVSKLGEGGMGVVWRARHETLQKDVAVKVLPPGFAHEPEAVQRFLREAQAAARLEHPNVVQVLDAGSAQGTHFIVMQFVDGTDLQKVLKKKGKLAVADALAVTKRIALALGAAHKMGIVHRDIKPANILLTKQGRVMVADFGLARDLRSGSTLTGTQEVMGTPQYLSPEQARGESLDGRSDLYSLGATLYTLLSGRAPFSGTTPVSIAVKHASEDQRPEPLRKIDAEIPAEIEALVEKMMSKKPADRFQTGEQVAAAIDALKSVAVKGDPSVMVTVSADRVLTAGAKRKLILTGVGGGLGCLALLIILLGILGPSKADKAFRAAGVAQTDGEKLARYGEVETKFPGTEWAEKARAQIDALRKGQLDRELLEVKTLALEGKAAFSEVTARLDRARAAFKEGAKAIDKLELDLHRMRVIARTRDFGDALKAHRPGDRAERFKDFVSPEALKKVGEGGVMFWVRVALGFLIEGPGSRVEEVEIGQDKMTVESRKDGFVPVKAVFHVLKTKERTTRKYMIHWVWQEGDWYLGDKGIQEEK
jgi:predicted Ser/Thr protein kinase